MPASSSTGFTIPEETKNKFPDLVALILGSQSMNDEERQYWINILPVMTSDQQKNLRGILENEKKQLAAIAKKYEAKTAPIRSAKATGIERKKRRGELQSKENQYEENEEKMTEELLKKIQAL